MMEFEEIHADFRLFKHGRVPQGCSMGWILQPFPILVMNLSGVGETFYRNAKLGSIPRPPGSVAYVIPNETRRSVTRSPEGIEFLVAGFAYEYRGTHFLNAFRIPNVLPETVQERIRHALLELDESEMCVPWYRTRIIRKKAGYDILAALMECAEPCSERTDEWTRLSPAVLYLNRHYTQKFNLPELLKQTPFSREHFYRIFRKRFHLAPQEYVTRLRIQEAVRLLLDSDLSVAEIGARVGWNDPFYFSKIFRTVIGVSPLNYRKNPGNGF